MDVNITVFITSPPSLPYKPIHTPLVRKLAAGEDGRNVSLTVNCRQEDVVLTWSNGDLPQLQEVTIFSSCIDPTNTSAVRPVQC